MTSIHDIPTPDQNPAVCDRRRRLADAETRLANARTALDVLRQSVESLEDASARAALAGEAEPGELATVLASIGPAERAVRVADRAVSLAAAEMADALAAAGDDYKTAVRREVQAAGRVWIKAAHTLAQAGAAMLEIRTATESSAAAAAVIRDLPHVPGPFQTPDLLLQMADGRRPRNMGSRRVRAMANISQAAPAE